MLGAAFSLLDNGGRLVSSLSWTAASLCFDLVTVTAISESYWTGLVYGGSEFENSKFS